MIEITTPENTVKEELSRAFIHAVAASIGCQISVPGQDYNAVDLVISAIKGSDARIDLQLKATENPKWNKEKSFLSFPVKAKTYAKLVDKNHIIPKILVVYVINRLNGKNITVDDKGLHLHGLAYWTLMTGRKPIAGTKKNSATVHLHRNNLFTARSLKRILARSHDWAMDRTRWERLCRD